MSVPTTLPPIHPPMLPALLPCTYSPTQPSFYPLTHLPNHLTAQPPTHPRAPNPPSILLPTHPLTYPSIHLTLPPSTTTPTILIQSSLPPSSQDPAVFSFRNTESQWSTEYRGEEGEASLVGLVEASPTAPQHSRSLCIHDISSAPMSQAGRMRFRCCSGVVGRDT